MAQKEGFGKGFIVRDYPGTETGVPLLSSFYFRFEKENGSRPVDNHLHSIRVLPGGRSEDLSPNADLNPAQVDNGKIELTYMDRDGDDAKDRYFYKVAHKTLTTGARRFQFRDVGCTNKCEQILPPPPAGGPLDTFGSVFVLVGFHIFFTGGRDHHIDKIGVYEEHGKLIVEFNDKLRDSGIFDDDLDPVFGYVVDYAWVKRRPGLNIVLGEESGSTSGGARVSLPPGPKVIRGFRFDFRTDDHHSREIGVVTSNEKLEVYYSDQNADDPFRWKVRWASIGGQVIG